VEELDLGLSAGSLIRAPQQETGIPFHSSPPVGINTRGLWSIS